MLSDLSQESLFFSVTGKKSAHTFPEKHVANKMEVSKIRQDGETRKRK